MKLVCTSTFLTENSKAGLMEVMLLNISFSFLVVRSCCWSWFHSPKLCCFSSQLQQWWNLRQHCSERRWIFPESDNYFQPHWVRLWVGIQHFRWQSRNLWWTLNSNPHTVHLAVWYRFSQCRGYPDLGWCSLSSYALWPVFSSFWDLCNKDLLRSSLSFCIRQWCLCRSFAAPVFELFDHIFEEWQFVPIILKLRRIDDYLQLC